MKFNKKRISILAAVTLLTYSGIYLILRSNGTITRYEYRGIEKGNKVAARESEWNDLIPSLSNIEKVKVNSLNLIFYPLEKIEELIHNRNYQRANQKVHLTVHPPPEDGRRGTVQQTLTFGEKLMKQGKIGNYFWYDLGGDDLRDTLRRVSPRLLGLRAVNTSWDSGQLTPDRPDFPCGWATHHNVAVSPPIDAEMIATWPVSHDDYCDEWWFFGEVPQDFDYDQALCNYVGERIGNWADLEFEGGVELAKNIRRFQPDLLVGNGKFTYCVSRTQIVEMEAEQD